MGTRISGTNSQHQFSMIPAADIQRSVFDRSCGHKTTFDSGYLVPILVDEALPGDTFDMKVTAFGRLTTLLRPIMDNLYIDLFFFAVPNRLLWTNWKKFNGEQVNPGDSTTFLLPQVTAAAGGGWTEGSIGDYMGLPTKINSLASCALPLRAYNLIWNEWFRDENLQNSVTVNTGDGPDANTDYTLLRRGKRHDYFTSSLPFAQKGTAVSLPLGISAKVSAQAEHTTTGSNPAITFRRTDTNAVPGANTTASFGAAGALGFDTGAQSTDATLYPSNLVADLATATAATINQIRQAVQIQRLLERDARGGTRYTEILRAHFGVTSPDARLQRPEYLGGGTQMLNIKAVETTADGGASIPVGKLTAYGTFASSHEIGFRQSFTEHCVILGLACVRADLNYQQGLERMWSRRTRYDFYWPALAHLGEQSVLNKEIYAKNDANDDLTFGYQERYAEYRYKPSIVSGRFRSNATTPLDSWHLAQNFTALPALNSTFIQETPPVNRIVAVTTEPQIYADFFFKYRCARPMPVFSVPGLMDHF